MSTSSLARLVMLQPVTEGDLYDIVKQQITHSLPHKDQSLSVFVHVCQTLFWCLVETTFETMVREERWSYALGRYVDQSLQMYMTQQQTVFMVTIAQMLEYNDQARNTEIVEQVEIILWQVVSDTSDFVKKTISEYQQK